MRRGQSNVRPSRRITAPVPTAAHRRHGAPSLESVLTRSAGPRILTPLRGTSHEALRLERWESRGHGRLGGPCRIPSTPAEGDVPQRITLAHSPDADDAFMFYALATGKVGDPGL